ncbi:unnamed protein product [Coccothraustes coccothraustes]
MRKSEASAILTREHHCQAVLCAVNRPSLRSGARSRGQCCGAKAAGSSELSPSFPRPLPLPGAARASPDSLQLRISLALLTPGCANAKKATAPRLLGGPFSHH